jgi:hypothetical protein
LLVAEPTLVQTDPRGRLTLPGHPGQRFAMHVDEDGGISLQPVMAVADVQGEFDSDPELQDLLACAAASASIRRSRLRG